MKNSNKKILIAALLISFATNGYGAVIWADGKDVTVSTDRVISANTDRMSIKNDGSLTVAEGTTISVEKSSGSSLTVGAAEVQNSGGNFTNNGTIDINAQTGIQIKGDKDKVATGTNNNIITASGAGTKGVELIGKNASFINSTSGKITFEDSVLGIYIKDGASAENRGYISISGAGTKGIDIANGAFINEGKIAIENGATGIRIADIKGKFSNSGQMEVTGTGSVGIEVTTFTDGDIINSEKGTISVKGLDSTTGIDITTSSSVKGNLINAGTIDVLGNEKLTSSKNEATGVKVNGSNVTFKNTGIINSVGAGNSESGYNTKGINITTGKAINEGVITASNGGNGVYVNGKNAHFLNENLIKVQDRSVGITISTTVPSFDLDKNIGVINSVNGIIEVGGGKGVKVLGNGSFINQGNILVKNGVGISAEKLKQGEKGTIENVGLIQVEGANAMGVQINDYNGMSNAGTIHATKGIGMQIKGNEAKGINNSLIVASGTGTKGVDVANGTLINAGKIKVENSGLGVDITDIKGKFSNSGEMEVVGTGSIGIKIASFTDGDIINAEKGTISVKGLDSTTGIDITTSSSVKGTIINAGTIDALGNEKLTASKNEATGVKVNGENITFKNTGIINSVGAGNSESGYNTKGMNIFAGKAINEGTITASNGGNGVFVNGKNAHFLNDNIIKVDGKSVGIAISTSSPLFDTDKNTGIINGREATILVNEGKGVKVSGHGSFLNQGSILIKSGTGISAEKFTEIAKGTIENAGMIQVEGEGSAGAQANDFSRISNSGTINVFASQFTAGMKAYGSSSSVINSKAGIINHTGNGSQTSNAMIAQNGGTAINEGEINVSERYTSAMGASGTEADFASSIANSSILNGGTINIYQKSYGMKLDGKSSTTDGKYNYAFGTNSGTINNLSGDTAVYLNGGIFSNEGGTILAGTGKAIVSYGSSNNIVRLSKSIDGQKDSVIEGSINGGLGVDLLVLDGKNGENRVSDLNINRYEAILLTGGANSAIENSKISLEYNSGIKKYIEQEGENISSQDSTLTIKNSTFAIDFKDSLTNPNIENPIIKATELKFEGDTYLSFNSSDGRQEFNLSEALGGEVKINSENANYMKTAIWSYDIKDGDFVAKKQRYYNVLTTGKMKSFAKLLESKRSGFSSTFAGPGVTLNSTIIEAEQLKTSTAFTNALTELSGGQYAYLADIALNNLYSVKRELKNRSSDRNGGVAPGVNSYTSNAFYLNFNNKLKGLMDVDEKQDGVIGTFEKQISKEQKFGLFFGGGHSQVNFNSGKIGSASLDVIYAGGYLKNNFTPNISLTSQFGFEHQFANVKRIIDYTSTKYTFRATTPTMVFSLGTELDASLPLNKNWRLSAFTGLDWSKVVQGNIIENDADDSDRTNELRIRNNTGTHYYDSVIPSLGIKIENSNYLFGKKYSFLLNTNYYRELGNIKDGKQLLIKKLGNYHKVKTTENDGVLSLGVLGTLNLTENLMLNGGYTHLFSKEYKSDRATGGFTYRFDSLTNAVTAPVGKIFDGAGVNSNVRHRGSLSLSLEGSDLDDRENTGSYQTSAIINPVLKLGINDTKTNFSYYFETAVKNNTWFGDLKDDSYNPEGKARSAKVHAEVRYTKPYNWGNYGISLGYRFESARKQRLVGASGSPNNPNPNYFTDKIDTHNIRVTPSFRYNITNKLSFGGSTIVINSFTTLGERKDCYDLRLENQYGFIYTFNPKWKYTLNYFREDRYLDLDYITYDALAGYDKYRTKGYLLEQIRTSLLYTFDNGSTVDLSFRIPFDQGMNYIPENGKPSSNVYENRYGIKYTHKVSPILSTFAGITMVTTRYKNNGPTSKLTGPRNTKTHDLKTEIGFIYNFGF